MIPVRFTESKTEMEKVMKTYKNILVLTAMALMLAGCGAADVSRVEAATGSGAYTAEAKAGPGERQITSLTGPGEIVIFNDPAPSGGESKEAPESVVTAGETAAAALEQAAGSVYTTDRVRLRTAPSTESETLTVLEPGRELSLLGYEDSGWARVRWQGTSVYISRDYISEKKPVAPTAAERPTVPVRLETETVPGPAGTAQQAVTAANMNTEVFSAASSGLRSRNGYADGEAVGLDPAWKYADFSAIHTGSAVMYLAKENRNNIVIGVNAGHGTKGGSSVKTWCHPDKTPKLTGGTTSAGATKAVAVSTGMNFTDGTAEHTVTLRMARLLRDRLLENGYSDLMTRDGKDVQLDNVARTVICNNAADCHISLHWDSDGLSYDKGCYYMAVPKGLKTKEPAASVWEQDNALGEALVAGLREQGLKIYDNGSLVMDLTQTAFSSVPSVDIELGNQRSDHGSEALSIRAEGLLRGVNRFFGK